MEFGLRSDDLAIIRSIMEAIIRVEKVIIYGSRAKGNYRMSSDIDLALVGDELTLSDQLAVMGKLDESTLPYTADVSIFHKIENPDLIDHINRIGKILYER